MHTITHDAVTGEGRLTFGDPVGVDAFVSDGTVYCTARVPVLLDDVRIGTCAGGAFVVTDGGGFGAVVHDACRRYGYAVVLHTEDPGSYAEIRFCLGDGFAFAEGEEDDIVEEIEDTFLARGEDASDYEGDLAEAMRDHIVRTLEKDAHPDLSELARVWGEMGLGD